MECWIDVTQLGLHGCETVKLTFGRHVVVVPQVEGTLTYNNLVNDNGEAVYIAFLRPFRRTSVQSQEFRRGP